MHRMENTHKFSMENTHKFSMESTHKFSIRCTFVCGPSLHVLRRTKDH